MTDAIAKATDPHRTLAFSGAKMGRAFFFLGLVCLAPGSVIAWIGLDTTEDWVIAAGSIGLGVLLVIYGLTKWTIASTPALLMSPQGLRLHIDFLKTIHIPWREVRGIDTIDITGTVRGHTITFQGVTVVLVTRAFYNRHIHVDSWLLRGPGWDTNFIPKGNLVQVALHHEALPATAAELRIAAETRWHAFRDATTASTSVPKVRAR